MFMGFSAKQHGMIIQGVDHETPVSEDYKEGDNKFTGKLQKVTIENLSGKK